MVDSWFRIVSQIDGNQVKMYRLLLSLALVLEVTVCGAADWPQFRGVNGAGHAEGDGYPVEFGPDQNVLWQLPMASGHSSPCCVGNHLFLTTYDHATERLKLVCVDRQRGAIHWERSIDATAIEKGHPSFNPASSTPASDGERVVAYFGSFGLICFNRDGDQLWERRMPLTKSYAGNATSPVIVNDQVILYRGNFVDHFLLALDKRTGKERWRVDQEEPFHAELACTACPITIDDKIVVHSARSVQAFAADTGKRIWVAKCATTATSTPVFAGDEVLVAAWNKMGEPALRPKFPSFDELVQAHDQDADTKISQEEFPKLWIFYRPDGSEAPENGATLRFRSIDGNRDGELDANEWNAKLAEIARFRSGYQQHGLLAIPLDGQGVLGAGDVRTLEQQGIPEVPSPLYHEGIVYLLKNGGTLTCLDAKTGQRLARVRTQGKGTHYASPIIAGGRLYATAGNGQISVLSLDGQRPRVLAVNDMGDATYATPAAVAGTLYVRTHSRLYAFRKP